EGFGRDGLLQEFMAAAPDDDRRDLVRSVVPALHEARSHDDAAWLSRVLEESAALWEERTATLQERLRPGEDSEELGAYLYWLGELQLGVERIEPQLSLAASH